MSLSIPPTLLSHPSAQDLCEGDSTVLSANATGTGLDYQWYKDSIAVSGATGSTFNITTAETGDAGNYHCVITADCGQITTNSARIRVFPAAKVGTQPNGGTICAG